ncbi:ABC transporter ATP-binding protein [Candidatus Xianfuyuplasma coldseepsis]|uniref:ABC transporter ATP-binding protein n=1 Tax=Candidatus Xianfuyuplasma coldseepsis TaxID=2782163 RepID=A0A7L7KUT2_9MOLU|nr:ABC transporter ATP-binding protein [Xianfuyuplasma coldseepsis]QMS85528.1 ABC transporter ATP-binding protein [Xianfuyuplasma coldseepsis]
MNTLEVQQVTKTFKLSKKQQKLERTNATQKIACNQLSFTAYPGEIYGLLGPNGAGKTTALRMISTLIKPDSGDVFVGDSSVVKEATEVRGKIGFLTSELKLEDHFTPNYLFTYFSRLHGVEDEVSDKRKNEMFTRFGIDEFMEVKVGELSTGMKQKLSIAISLVHDPDFIIFDEPTNGLDVLTARVVTDYLLELKEKGKTVILSTHILSVVEKLCDRVGIIINGKMKITDTLDAIKSAYPDKSLEDIFFDFVAEEALEGGMEQ